MRSEVTQKTEFELKVDYCRQHLDSKLIDNTARGHYAAYLFKNLLEVAATEKDKVRIISGTLNASFYDQFREQIQACMDAGVEIELIVLDNPKALDENAFVNDIKNYSNGSVFTSPLNPVIGAPHMMLIGEKGQRFRLEVDHTQTKAVASFNNPHMGSTLLNIYRNARNAFSESHSGDNTTPGNSTYSNTLTTG